MNSSTSLTLGVIAGAGKFPAMVIEGARQTGHRIVVVGLRDIADPGLAELADEFHWVAPLRLGEWIGKLTRAGARNAVMAGYVRKHTMYRPFGVLAFLPDWRFLKLWFRDIPDKQTDTVLKAVADLLGRHGIVLEDVTTHCPQAVAQHGPLTVSTLSPPQRRDLEFGWPLAKQMAKLDIGQAITVKDTEVIAVEAIEGTDSMIERTGALCKRAGWMMIKVARPQQDMRFDVPTIGPNTIANLSNNGASALVIEAGKTVIVDRDETLAMANRLGITVAGRAELPIDCP